MTECTEPNIAACSMAATHHRESARCWFMLEKVGKLWELRFPLCVELF